MDEIINANAVSFCTQCGAANAATSRFCDSCGAPHASAFAPPPPPMGVPFPTPYASTPATGTALFDQRSVALATFIGSPIAGGIVMGINYHRLGKTALAAAAIAGGLALTYATGLLVGRVPPIAFKILPVVLMFVMLGVASQLQGPAVEQHASAGGRIASRWNAAWIGIAILVPLLVAIFANAVAAKPNATAGTRVAIGLRDEVFYSGSATEEEAVALGMALKRDGYYTDRGISTFLSKFNDRFTISFVVKQGLWEDPKYVTGYQQVVREIAPVMGGLPIDVKLIDKEQNVKKEMTVQ